MGEVVDGQYQKYTVSSGDYIRQHFFGTHPELLAMVEDLTDAKLRKLRRGGHDPEKVYAAYHAAVEHVGAPTVILAKTIKGYGLGEAGEGRNVTHQQKKLNEKELREFRDRFGIPIADRELLETPFYRPADDSEEIEYLLERRRALGGFVPQRGACSADPLAPLPPASWFAEFLAEHRRARGRDDDGAGAPAAAPDERHGRSASCIVPIVPDEARTFGMDALFRKFGIYSHLGQRYEPADSDVVLYYREATDGQLLEEGITEAGRHGVVHRRRHRLRHARREHDSVLLLLLDVRLPAHRRSDLAERRRARHAASWSAPPPAARRSPARGCSTRTATATCSPAPCRPCAPTIRPSPTRSR